MRHPVNIIRSINLGLICAAVLLALGATNDVAAQDRDPFRRMMIKVPRKSSKPTSLVKKEKPVPTVVGAPPIQQRIENYRTLRARAAELGLPAPKPTSVLTVNEVEVTGVFRTPRGYAAMVEATPIKLSYTVYPGEKFYDGYLVAIEDNRLVFRRETKMTDGKVTTVAENKGLKIQTVDDMLVPRVETTNQPTTATNPTTTVPAVAVSSNPQEPVLTADNKPKSETAEKDSINADSVKQPARQVNPRKSN
jgi:hypothetical protein